MLQRTKPWTEFLRDPCTYIFYVAAACVGIGLAALVAQPNAGAAKFIMANALTATICVAIGATRWCSKRWRNARSESEIAEAEGDDVESHPALVGLISVATLLVCNWFLFVPEISGALTKTETPASRDAERNVSAPQERAPIEQTRKGDAGAAADAPPGAPPRPQRTISQSIETALDGPRQSVAVIREWIRPAEDPPVQGSMWVLVGDRISATRHGTDFRPDASGDGPARFNSVEAVRAAVSSGERIDATGLQARQCAAALPIERCSRARPVGGQRRMRQIFFTGDGGVWVRVES